MVECTLGQRSGQRTRADIRLRLGGAGSGAVFCIDVAIVDPGAYSHVHTHSSHMIPDAAASFYELHKLRQYNRRIMGEGVIVIPFVIETTGSLGKLEG